MRPTNSAQQGFQPDDPPSDPAQMQRYLRELNVKLKAAFDALAEGFDPVAYAAPPKPRKGMRRYADGVSWNPGSGEGLYRFNGTTWVFVG